MVLGHRDSWCKGPEVGAGIWGEGHLEHGQRGMWPRSREDWGYSKHTRKSLERFHLTANGLGLEILNAPPPIRAEVLSPGDWGSQTTSQSPEIYSPSVGCLCPDCPEPACTVVSTIAQGRQSPRRQGPSPGGQPLAIPAVLPWLVPLSMGWRLGVGRSCLLDDSGLFTCHFLQ